jgi:trk system potassium uptake protein TrkH
MINFQPVSNVIGVLLSLLGAIMILLGLIFMLDEQGTVWAFGKSGIITLVFGAILYFVRFGHKKAVHKREGYLIVALAWIAMIVFGALPYYFADVTTGFSDNIFESASGFTTTGATIFENIEILPNSVLLWRSLTQWLGGMGVIVLTVALLPLLGIGGIQLFMAEAPGPTSDKIHPRIQGTAKRLWFIYVGLTTLLTGILYLEGMNPFDAINHGLTTMATGGFSTHNASVANYSPLIQYTLILFMIIAGTNYAMLYFGIKGKFKNVFRNDEFKFYIIVVAVFTILMTAGIIHKTHLDLESAFRAGLFQIVSLITTTGFVTTDYSIISPFVTSLAFLMLFFGASAGSTSGGIKLIRHLVFVKNSLLEFKRLLHPRAIVRVKLNKQLVPGRIMTHILVFLLMYLGVFVLGTIVISTLELDFLSAAGAVATCLGNVGPGIGSVGPVNNFAHVAGLEKIILSFIMILGRLELFTIIILFTPFFWRNN